jgi:heme exporter protein D
MDHQTIQTFFAMGGYARFVWPAYAVAIAVMVAMLAQSLAAYRRAKRDLAAQERTSTPRRRRKT